MSKSVVFIWIIALLYASWLLFWLSIPYLALKPGVEFLKTKAFVYHIKIWRFSFYTHVFSSIFVIITGIFQFLPFIIKNKPKVHRLLGYVYIITLLFLAGPSGLVIAFYANGGFIAQVGFSLLAMFWLSTTLLSLTSIWKRDFVRHSHWMVRSYALTLAAVTLRLYGYLFDVFKLDFMPVQTYQFLAYASWIPNLILAEWLIRKGSIRKILFDTKPNSL